MDQLIYHLLVISYRQQINRSIMLSFQKFQEQVLSMFHVTEENCYFGKNDSGFLADISYVIQILQGKPTLLVFQVNYITDNENCNYGRWLVRKYYPVLQGFSDSLIQGIENIGKQTTECINGELQVFFKIQKGWRKAKFQELFESFDELTKTENK